MECTLCPRRCGAERTVTDGFGFCQSPATPHIARAALHFGEEPCISGKRGSGTVFFTGCTLRCAYCQNKQISRTVCGRAVTPQQLADTFRDLYNQGAHNINLVNPTHYVPAILEALSLYRPPIPIVYNSGGYERVETLRPLDGWVDVYLPDLKYLSSDLSRALSGAADYAAFAVPAILEMARQTGLMRFDENGIAQKGTIVRHLALPGHTKETMAVLDLLAERLPRGVFVSLMFQYTPMGEIDGFPELSRTLTRRECDKLSDYLCTLDLDGYVQQKDSVGVQHIPAFEV